MRFPPNPQINGFRITGYRVNKCTGHPAQDVQPVAVPLANLLLMRRGLLFGPKAVGYEAAVGVLTLTICGAETWCAVFGLLDRVDEVGLFYSAGVYTEAHGFLPYLGHFH